MPRSFRSDLPSRVGLFVVTVVVASAAGIALPAAPSAAGVALPVTASTNSDRGCVESRPAVAHHPGGKIVEAAPVRMPCSSETGHYTGETTIAVTKQGTVWFSAADWEWALVRSHDQGATWKRFAVPGPQAYPGCGIGSSGFTPCDTSQRGKYNTVADAFLWADPYTSKIFWSKTYGYAACSSMNMSADDGKTWEAVTRFACPGGDYEKIGGGPPPAGGAEPTGYPNVLYACVNGYAPTFVVGPSRVCYKSLDGGTSWLTTGAPVTPSPLAPGCLHFQEPQVVAPDGTLYVPLGCALDLNRIMVAISENEGATWRYEQVPTADVGMAPTLIGGVSIAVDRSGTLYVLWPGADEKAYLAVTNDKGETWNGPLMASAPGVTTGTPRAQIAAREPGHIAIAYYGHPDGKSDQTLNGYLTESFNASDRKPLFYSALLNDPNDPLYFPTNGGTLPRNDYLGVTIAPEGTPWTALVKLLSPKPDDEGFIQSTGFAGHLEFLAGAEGKARS